MVTEINYLQKEVTFIGYEKYEDLKNRIIIHFLEKNGFINKREMVINNTCEIKSYEINKTKCLKLIFLDKKSISELLEDNILCFYIRD